MIALLVSVLVSVGAVAEEFCFRARCVDEAGRPVRHATMRLIEVPESPYAACNAEGEIELRVEVPPSPSPAFYCGWDAIVEFHAPGRGRVRRKVWLGLDGVALAGDVVLPLPGAVEGRVFFTGDTSAAMVDVLLVSLHDDQNRWNWQGASDLPRRPDATTTASTRDSYRFQDVAPGWYVVVASLCESRHVSTAPFDVRSGRTAFPRSLRRELPSGLFFLEGRALDATGRPIHDIEVEALLHPSNDDRRKARTDSRGRFRIAVEDEYAGARLHFIPKAPLWCPDVSTNTPRETVTIRSVIPQRSFEIRIVDGEGSPVDEVEIEIVVADGPQVWHSMLTEGRGLAPLPETAFTIVARPQNMSWMEREIQDPDEAKAGIELRAPSRDSIFRTHVVTGTVHGPDGPLAGARVQAVSRFDTIESSTQTDERGVFRLSVEISKYLESCRDYNAPNSYVATAPGLAGVSIEWSEDAPLPDQLQFVLPRGEALEGQLLGHDPTEGPTFVALRSATGPPCVVPVRFDGTFCSQPLAPGQWDVTLQPLGRDLYFSPSPSGYRFHPIASFIVTQGSRVQLDLDASHAPCIRGQMLDPSDGPRTPWKVGVPRGGGHTRLLEIVLADLDGRFLVPESPEGRHEVDVSPLGPGAGVWVETVLEVHPGAPPWQYPTAWGRVEGAWSLPGSAERWLRFSHEAEDGELRFGVGAPIEADGSFTLECVPVGRGRLIISNVAHRIITVRPGQTTTVHGGDGD